MVTENSITGGHVYIGKLTGLHVRGFKCQGMQCDKAIDSLQQLYVKGMIQMIMHPFVCSKMIGHLLTFQQRLAHRAVA